jgi:hypothetical protein
LNVFLFSLKYLLVGNPAGPYPSSFIGPLNRFSCAASHCTPKYNAVVKCQNDGISFSDSSLYLSLSLSLSLSRVVSLAFSSNFLFFFSLSFVPCQFLLNFPFRVQIRQSLLSSLYSCMESSRGFRTERSLSILLSFLSHLIIFLFCFFSPPLLFPL